MRAFDVKLVLLATGTELCRCSLSTTARHALGFSQGTKVPTYAGDCFMLALLSA